MQPGVAFPHRQPHELLHLRPLMGRLQDILVHPPQKAAVAVHAGASPRRRGAWNVHVFRGLPADPEAQLRRLRSPLRRRSRFEQVNAHGPRLADLAAGLLPAAEVSRFGHPALNEAEGLAPDPEGPVAWVPAQGGRALADAAAAVAALARDVPVLAVLPPRAPKALRRRLAAAEGLVLAPADADPYRLLHGARAALGDGGGLGLEAYCAGLPVALLQPDGGAATAPGLLGELAERVPRFHPGDPLRDWAWHPDPASDTRWARDLLVEPSRRRNDLFAAQLRAVAVEVAR